MLSLNHLKTFMAVLKFGSFTRAARQLNLTQPAVSGHIAALEAELGASLFTRTGRAVVLTDEGRVLEARGKKVIEELDRMRSEIEDLKDLKGGRITLGASRIIGVYVLPKLLADFQERFPGIKLQLVVHSAHTILQKLEDNAFDLAVIAEGIPITSQNIGFKVIGKDPLAIIAPADHPLAKKGVITVSEVCSERFILPGEQTASAGSLRKRLEDVGIRLQSTIEMNEQGAIKRAVKGRGACHHVAGGGRARDQGGAARGAADGELAAEPPDPSSLAAGPEVFAQHRGLHEVSERLDGEALLTASHAPISVRYGLHKVLEFAGFSGIP